MALSVTYTVFDNCIISESRSGVERDYVSDSIGSTVALLDSTQSASDEWFYWPYGEVYNRTGTNATPFTFVGALGYFKDTTGRLYVRARHYATSLCQWITVDPMWPRQPIYQYAMQSPTIFVDPSGMIAPALPVLALGILDILALIGVFVTILVLLILVVYAMYVILKWTLEKVQCAIRRVKKSITVVVERTREVWRTIRRWVSWPQPMPAPGTGGQGSSPISRPLPRPVPFPRPIPLPWDPPAARPIPDDPVVGPIPFPTNPPPGQDCGDKCSVSPGGYCQGEPLFGECTEFCTKACAFTQGAFPPPGSFWPGSFGG